MMSNEPPAAVRIARRLPDCDPRMNGGGATSLGTLAAAASGVYFDGSITVPVGAAPAGSARGGVCQRVADCCYVSCLCRPSRTSPPADGGSAVPAPAGRAVGLAAMAILI